MTRKGQDLEKLVKSIENALKTNKSAKVESPAYLVDKTTGRKREFDVLITFDEGPRTLKTAIECRKRKGKVGSPEVEGFFGKCQDNSINFMAIVSSLGFTKEALKKAAHHGIQCLTLKEATSFEWLGTRHVFNETISVRHISVELPNSIAPADSIQICDEKGTPIQLKALQNFAYQLVSEYGDRTERSGEYSMNFELTSAQSGIYALTTDGKVWSVAKIKMGVNYSRTITTTPLTLHTYADAGKGVGITNFAAAGFSTNGIDFDLMIVEQKDGSKNVMLVKK